MAPTLAYWEIRGLAMPIRFLLEQAGVEYEDKLYRYGTPPDFDRSNWTNEKFSLGLDFPNLPYYIDGDVKLTQSHVILRYLGRKHNMAGETETERVRADLVATQVYDYLGEFGRIAYNPDFLSLKDNYAKTLPDKLKLLVNFLGANKFVAGGDKLTYADFVLFEFLENQLYFDPSLLKDSPTLEAFHKRILSLEAIDKYFKSSRIIKFPFNGAPSYFGGAYSELNLQKMSKKWAQIK